MTTAQRCQSEVLAPRVVKKYSDRVSCIRLVLSDKFQAQIVGHLRRDDGVIHGGAMLCKFANVSGRPYTLEVAEYMRADESEQPMVGDETAWFQAIFIASVLSQDVHVPIFVHNQLDCSDADIDNKELTDYSTLFPKMAARTLLAGVAVFGEHDLDLAVWGTHSATRRLTLQSVHIGEANLHRAPKHTLLC